MVIHTSSVFDGKIYVFSGSTKNISQLTTSNQVYAYVPSLEPVAVIAENDIIPKFYSLSQNYPNPFNPVTTIKYSIPTDLRYEYQDVRLIVYDILGREVATLVTENQKPANYEVDFDASELTSGIYFYQLNAEDYTETKKMILLK